MTTIRERESAVVRAQVALGELRDGLTDALEAIADSAELSATGKATRAQALGLAYRDKLTAAQATEAQAIGDYRQAVDRGALETPGEGVDVLGAKPRRRDYLKADGGVNASAFAAAQASWREGLAEAHFELAAKRDLLESLSRLPSDVLTRRAADADPVTLAALRQIAIERAASAPEADGGQHDTQFLGENIGASLLLERSFGSLRSPVGMEPGTWPLVQAVAAREAADLTGEQLEARAAIAEGRNSVQPTAVTFDGTGPLGSSLLAGLEDDSGDQGD